MKQNRESEINPHIDGQLILNKGDKNTQQRKNSLFSKWDWENWTAAYKSMKLEHSLILYTRINSKWLKDLNMRQDAMKLLEENIGKTFWHKSLQCFLRSVFQGNRNKSKNKQYKLLHSEWKHKQNEKTTYGLGENVHKRCDWQGLNSQNIKTAHTTQPQKSKQPNQKMGRIPKQTFLQRNIQMVNGHIKRCSSLLTIREM